MQYIRTGLKAITVEEIMHLLESQDKTKEFYIIDDNEEKRPVCDISLEDGKIFICDF